MNLTINGKELEKSFVFSGGEVQIRLPAFELSRNIVVRTRLTSSDKLMELMLVADALNRDYLTYDKTLDLSYMPYARQDRQCYKGESFALPLAVKMINMMGFDEVLIDDIHSDVSQKHYPIKNSNHITQVELLDGNSHILKDIDVLISPDKGARQKTRYVGDYFNLPVVYSDKVRNTDTGYIKEITINNPDILKDKNVLIIDDICDGGMTFILLAEKLKECGVKSISLYVTHGIFSKGLKPLKDAEISNIYCINNFLEEIYL